jgi:hypothetical protein
MRRLAARLSRGVLPEESMRTIRTTLAALLIVVVATTGCNKSEETAAFRGAVRKIGLPGGSVISYAPVPGGTQFIPGRLMGATNPLVILAEGYVLFVDEKPKYDWAHPFRLMLIPKGEAKTESLFHGDAIPDFTFKRPDGSLVTNWRQY